MSEKYICINRATKIYPNNVMALNNISLEFEKNGFVFITGESGSGKTTLMNIMTGLDVPTCGEIIYDQLSDWDKIRNNKIGIIFQNNNIFEELTVYENLCLVLRMINIPVQSYSDIIKNALKFVGLSGYEKRKCNQLSAGQKQRVSIARVIIKNPCVIFADEPTGNLDSETAEQILDLLNKISKKCLVVMISHDRESAFRYADRIISLKKGQIVEDISNAKRKNLYDKDYYIKGEKQACIKYKDFSLTDYISNHLLTNQSFVHRIDLELVAHHDKETQKNDILYQHYSEKNFSINDFTWMIQSHVYYNRTKILLGILLVSFICSIFFAFFLL
ncbi:MAG: ABC transporter ATP-binding protein [Agathobacter sp.]|uniref:ABC transporter ATP-binding protein n=1 Tax=Agathobacter sp. TaxID=2021311 RepID=UPI0025854825|nr:ABC transporter ATP-binding protein [Agathobacter sp.]MCR5677075.1 ABC transporter ATP-binding protein [Agathobacter sp.]